MTTFYRIVANFETSVYMSNDPIREYHHLVEAYKSFGVRTTFWRNYFDDVFVDRWVNNSPEIQGLSDDPIDPADRLRVSYRDSIETLLREGQWPQGVAKPYIPKD